MTKQSPKMIVFDLDDTLYPEMQFVLGGFRAAAQVLAVESGLAAQYLYELFVAILHREGMALVFDKALAQLGLKRTDALIERMVQAYRFHEPALSLFPGMVDVLAMLRGKAILLGIITDGPIAVQKRKIETLGLDKVMNHIVYSDSLGGRATWKPSQAPYEAMERISGLCGNALVYVGDNPTKDFQGAQSRGWRTVRVRFPGTFHAAKEDAVSKSVVVSSVEELRHLLLSLLDAPV